MAYLTNSDFLIKKIMEVSIQQAAKALKKSFEDCQKFQENMAALSCHNEISGVEKPGISLGP